MPTASLSGALRARMDYLTQRQGVIAGNIANANTPNYLPADLSFKAHVAAAGNQLKLAATSGNHFQGATAGSTSQLNRSARYVEHNGNGVRLDEQLIKLNQTQLDYRAMVDIRSKLGSFQRIAIGRGQ